MVREELTSTAERRGAEAPRLISLLRGDLDWIVMKSLEKDRARRYQTANGLARDVERFQKHEPVAARPPSVAYRMGKFVRRNRVLVGAGATVAVALALGLCVSIWQAARATRAQQQQSRLRATAEANAYAADMYVAQQALLADDLGRARTLLDRYRPGSGLEHLRGFEWRCLAAEARSDYAAMDASSDDGVHLLALSPDGRALAVSRYITGIELRDAACLHLIATLETNVQEGGVAFSPTGGLLAASAPGDRIRLWGLAPLRVLGELVHTNLANRLCFSPDGRHLASFHPDIGDLCVWDLETRRTVRRYPGLGSTYHQGGPVCFSPDGGQLAVGEGSGRIRILDWAADRVVVDFQAHEHTDGVMSLAYSPDGKLLASGNGFYADDIRLWNPATGKRAGTLAEHSRWIAALQFAGAGQKLLSVSGQTIGIWDVPAQRLVRKLRGHLNEVMALAFDERSTNLITGCRDGTLARWNIDQAPPHPLRLALPGRTAFLGWNVGGASWPGFAAGGAAVAFLDQQGTVALWRPGEPQPLSVIADLGTNNSALATAPARGLLACSTPQGPVRVWSLKSASLLTNLPPGGFARLGFSKREDVLVAVNTPGLVSIWDARTWTTRCSFTTTNYADAPALSPDGQLLVLGGVDGKVEWWDAVRGHLLARTPGHHSCVPCLDFSPDGRLLASGSDDGTVALWDVRARRCTHLWRADRGSTEGVAFSPDGTRLATGTGGEDDCVGRLWDLRTRQEVLTLAGTGGFFYAVKFSPRGDALLCLDHTGEHCYQWRVPSFAELDAGW